MKRIRIILWGLVLFAVVGIVVAKVMLPTRPRPQQPEQPESGKLFAVPPITLTDQDAKGFSTAQLLGRPWVADFIFTSCPGSCPIMSHQMEELQKKTPAALALVSFSVDPEHDTPAILKEYGQGLHADFSRWHFLTGTHQQMVDAARDMKISVHPADKDFALSHSDKLLLVDQTGNVVGVYDGTSSMDLDRLVADATKLAHKGANAS